MPNTKNSSTKTRDYLLNTCFSPPAIAKWTLVQCIYLSTNDNNTLAELLIPNDKLQSVWGLQTLPTIIFTALSLSVNA